VCSSDLETIVSSRLEALPAGTRRLLEVVCLSAGPVLEAVAAAVAGLEPHDVDALSWLKSSRLVRGGDDRVEAWHDRIREAVVRGIDEERSRALHARMAQTLRGVADVDIDLVAWHLRAAGLVDQATDATLDAAERATAQLAFERAATLLQRALEVMRPEDLRRGEVCARLGDQLADAGRGREAAAAYLGALKEPGTTTERVLELRRRGAEQLLRAGHVDDGLEVLRDVLHSTGLSLARTPRTALLSLAFRRLKLALRGLQYVERPEAAVSEDVLRRIDTCWSVSMGLSMVDTIRGASFQSNQLLLALAAGEPVRVARALAAEAAFVATEGLRAERRAQELLEQARRLAERVGGVRLPALIDFCQGLTRFLAGHWRQSAHLAAEAERQFTEQGVSGSWEATNARLFGVWSLFYLGELRVLATRVPQLAAEAERRGDRYSLTSLHSGLANVAFLVRDDSLGARSAVQRVMREWSARGFYFQHYWLVLAETTIDLYEGRASLDRLDAAWPSLRSTMMLRIQNVRVEARYLRARVLLALNRRDDALELAFDLDEEGVDWARALSLLVRGLAQDSTTALRQAAELFQSADMQLFAAVARLRLGEALRAEGAALVREAVAWLEGQGVVRPLQFASMLAPRPPRAPRLTGS
jgi:tetratricopeptide (TPR) repeat protein